MNRRFSRDDLIGFPFDPLNEVLYPVGDIILEQYLFAPYALECRQVLDNYAEVLLAKAVATPALFQYTATGAVHPVTSFSRIHLSKCFKLRVGES